MAIPSFDLVDILRTIQKQRRFIIAVVIVCMAVGGAFYGIKKKKYKADANFLVNNPIYTDRGNVFRSRDTRFVDYFGGDDDLDKIFALATSDTVRDRIIRNCDFDKIYNQDINDGKGHAALMAIFNKNFNIKRTEYKDIEVSYIAYDAQTAATVANTAVKVIDDTWKHYYASMRQNVITAISDKMKQLNVSIDSLTDSLSVMRDKYGIYGIVSPGRENVMSGDIKGGGKGFGKGLEEIQNIESIKDQLVTDRAHYISAINEFSASGDESMGMVKLITRATAPMQPNGLSLLMILGLAGGLGFLFSVMYILIIAYYRKLNAVIR